jgi:hypothetical protein
MRNGAGNPVMGLRLSFELGRRSWAVPAGVLRLNHGDGEHERTGAEDGAEGEVGGETMTMGGTIKMTRLRKRFRRTLDLPGMAFSAAPGQVTGFVGPNEAGFP